MQTPTTTTMIQTNAHNHGLSAYLADAPGKVTFSSVIYTKKGKGGKGRDTVCYVMVTGFSYGNLLRKDRETIAEVTAMRLLLACVAADKRDKHGNYPTLADCGKAIAEQTVSLDKSIAGINPSTTDGVREPLMVDGVKVSGSWVNNGSVDAAKRGNVNMDGLCISRKVLVADPNQPPAVKSAGKTVAKKQLQSQFLRIGRWMSLSLTADTDYCLKLGGSAVVQATENGIDTIDGMTAREAYDATQRAA